MLLVWLMCGLVAAQPTMDCGGVAVCGVLTLESGFGSGNYKHPYPCTHGLWPEVAPYGNSQCITPPDMTPPSVIYPCYQQSGQSGLLEFEQHEWSAHGKCSGTKDAADFFSQICKMSSGPLAAMKNLTTLTLMQQAVEKAGYSVFAVDTVNSQLELSACLGKNGQWVLAAVKDFAVKCGQAAPTPSLPPTPVPAGQCSKSQHGPPCSNDAQCTAYRNCVRCASSGFCTDQPKAALSNSSTIFVKAEIA